MNIQPPKGRDDIAPVAGKPMPLLTAEEVKAYKDCCGSLYFKAGIPFAIFAHFLSTLKTSGSDRPKNNPFKKGFLFVGNVIIGTLLFSPLCYRKLLIMHEEIEEKKKREMLEMPTFQEVETEKPPTQPEDFSYSSDIMPHISEPVDSFSSDFSTSKLTIDDNKEVNRKGKGLTYDELRAWHRNRYANRSTSPPSSKPDSGLQPSTLPETSTEQEFKDESYTPPRRVFKNKYGDEIF